MKILSGKVVKLLPFLILGVGVLGLMALQMLRLEPQMVPPPTEAAVVETLLLEARSGTIPLPGDGFVRPTTEVTLVPQVSGRIIALSPQMVTGGRLRQGEAIITIDPTPFQADLDQAAANLAAAQAALANTSTQFDRVKSLHGRADASQAQLDDANARLRQAEADATRLAAAVARRRFDLEQTRITLPFDASVVSESVDVGDTVSIGQQLAEVYKVGEAEITVSLTEQDVALIPELWDTEAGSGQRPAIVTARFGGAPYHWDGRLDRVNAGLNRDTRTVDVVIVIDNPDVPGRPLDNGGLPTDAPPLLMGAYADVSIEGRRLDRFYTVPLNAVRSGDVVWLVSDRTTLLSAPVTRVRDTNATAYITSERNLDGERLIISDLPFALEDMPLLPASDGDAK